jgi:hypothetical protein
MGALNEHFLGIPQAIIAHADLRSPALESLLNTYSTLPNVRGTRQLANWSSSPDMCMTDKDLLSDGMHR